MAPDAASALGFPRSGLSAPGGSHWARFEWLLINGGLQAAVCGSYHELWACKLFKVKCG